jgi:hypothetical protein
MSLLTTMLYTVGCYETPWCRTLTGDAWNVIELIGVIFAVFGFATGFECSRIELSIDAHLSTPEAAA